MADTKGNCSEKPPCKCPMTVRDCLTLTHVSGYTKKDGTKVPPHSRHKPWK